jgi:hypothetical protein
VSSSKSPHRERLLEIFRRANHRPKAAETAIEAVAESAKGLVGAECCAFLKGKEGTAERWLPPDLAAQVFVNESDGGRNQPNPPAVNTFGAMGTFGGWFNL